jgi:hypothetical protein
MEHLRRWQWAVIGLFVGIIAGWIWSSVEDSGLSDATTLGSQQLERLLSAKPLEGRPRIKRITVHEQDGRYTVWMKVLQPDPNDPHPKNPRHYRYASERLNPTTPFLPDFRESPTQSVMWRINPSALTKPPVSGKRVAEGALPLWINGAAVRGDVSRWMQLKDWKPGPDDGRDPGSGAEVSLALRPATYQLHIALSQAQEKPASAQDLTITFNGSPLPPAVLLKSGSGTVLETTLPREGFVAGEDQVLRFSRKDRPVKIWEIRLIDPHYSIVDYLTYAESQHPEIKFSKAWWDTAHARYLICTIGGVVFFGGIWPTIVRLLTGAQPDTGKDGEDYDLDRFKGEAPKNETLSEPLPEVDTSQMEEELAKGAKPRGAVQDQSQAESAPVPLRAEPLAPVPIVDADRNSAEYKGEYYPVVRPAGDKHEGK